MTVGEPMPAVAVPRGGALAPPEVQQEVTTFLAVEAEALDDRAYGDWLELVAEGFTYQVPTPVLHDNVFDPGYDPRALLIDETRDSLQEFWFSRLSDALYDTSWGDHPPVRQRRFVSNVRARIGADDEVTYVVRSNLRLRMVRQATQVGELTAERHDVLALTPDGLRLRSRLAMIDDLMLQAPQIRVIL